MSSGTREGAGDDGQRNAVQTVPGLQEQQFEDCTPCRVIGATTFIGLGGYTYFIGHRQLGAEKAAIMKKNPLFGMRSRRASITGLAITFVGAGLYRLFM